MAEKTNSEVKQFYTSKKVFITGVSGFIGKVLLWKLLHSCSTIDKIYVLIRTRKGKDAQTRVEYILQTPIFDELRNNNSHVFEKVVAISGDISEDGLGISDKNKELLINEVNVIFNIAATLNMEAGLKVAVNMNTIGPMRILRLATKMKKLEVFVHTSTAYCYCEQRLTEEEVVAPSEDPYNIIQMSKWMSDELLESIKSILIKPHPNTYTYTKRLAEKVVADHYPQLPVVIARPSIVIPSVKEPFPGWVDNLNGPIGLLAAAGKGVCRSMLGDGSMPADFVAVDVVSNALIAGAWKSFQQMKQKKPDKIPVFNITSSGTEPWLWCEVVETGKQIIDKYPFSSVLWYPGGGMTTNKFQHEVIVLLFQIMPAYFIDFIMRLLGHKPFLMKIQKKIKQGTDVLKYFTTREWIFTTTNLMELKASMSTKDQEEFPVTMEGINDRLAYLKSAALGIRKYVLNEDPNDIPKCRQNMKILFVLDCLVRFLAIFIASWIICRIAGVLLDHYEVI